MLPGAIGLDAADYICPPFYRLFCIGSSLFPSESLEDDTGVRANLQVLDCSVVVGASSCRGKGGLAYPVPGAVQHTQVTAQGVRFVQWHVEWR